MTRFRNLAQLPAPRLALLFGLAAMTVCCDAAAQTQKKAAGPYVIELTVNPKPRVTETAMLFAVTDESGKPAATEKASGRADFSSGGLKGRATLRPEGANGMKGYGLMSAKPDLTIEVSITLAEGQSLKAVFKPLQSTPAGR